MLKRGKGDCYLGLFSFSISHRWREKNVQCDEGGDDASITRKKV